MLQKTISTLETPITCSSLQLSAYKEILDNDILDLQCKFTSLCDKLLLLDKKNTSTYFNEFGHFRRDQQSNITILQLRLADTAGTAKPVTALQPTKSLEMEKSRAPTFPGKNIEYPEFKRS